MQFETKLHIEAGLMLLNVCLYIKCYLAEPLTISSMISLFSKNQLRRPLVSLKIRLTNLIAVNHDCAFH